MWRLFSLIGLTVLLTGCVTNNKVGLKVHHINSLASTEINNGGFQGLEFLANAVVNPIDGQVKNRVNIIYLHGIGWTEDRNSDQLGSDFLGGIAKAYDLDASDGIVLTLCGEAAITELDKSKSHIYIDLDEPKYFDSALPGSQLKLDRLACMDKQTLNIDDTLEFVLYRVFWDNIFFDELQFAHIGQDDNRGASKDIAGLRRKYNRLLKDDLVNYGFSDAVMYLGPAGAEIRHAIKGAMCSAALDSSGYDFSQQGDVISFNDACSRASYTQIETNQFAFVTESLGSKIMFDVMREAVSDNRQSIHDDMIAGSETYMLANQIALLSLSDLSTTPLPVARGLSDQNRPRIIAMSELNDFLSYEIVPFYEQLWKRSIRPERDSMTELGDAKRREFINHIGFEMVDMRLEFADKIIPVLGSFVDPKEAHSGHAGEPELMLYLLCGAKNGELNNDGCLAADRFNK